MPSLPSWLSWSPAAGFTAQAWIDLAFYPVGALAPEELRELARLGREHREPPGTVVQVWPAVSRPGPRIQVVMAGEPLRRLDPAVDTVVVAGVGSSILGTAAFAREVANLTGRPVAGVVSGAGSGAATVDGLLGWNWYGPINQLDHWLSALVPARGEASFDAEVIDFEQELAGPAAPDAVLRELLSLPGVVRALGHSRGALQLGLVVGALAGSGGLPDGRLRVGTLGAVTALPSQVHSDQVLGALDPLGMINSTPAPCHLLPGRSHSINPDVPLGISLRNDVWGRFGADGPFA